MMAMARTAALVAAVLAAAPSAAVAHCADNEYERPGGGACGDCYEECEGGQYCLRHGPKAGCIDCAAGQYDSNLDPLSPCTQCPRGSNSEPGATECEADWCGNACMSLLVMGPAGMVITGLLKLVYEKCIKAKMLLPIALDDSTDIHSAGPAEASGQTKERCVFFSLRFGKEHGVQPMAEELQAALGKRGVVGKIVNMAGGGDIDAAVIDGIESCDTFLVFGSAKYGEDTGNPACTYYVRISVSLSLSLSVCLSVSSRRWRWCAQAPPVSARRSWHSTSPPCCTPPHRRR